MQDQTNGQKLVYAIFYAIAFIGTSVLINVCINHFTHNHSKVDIYIENINKNTIKLCNNGKCSVYLKKEDATFE